MENQNAHIDNFLDYYCTLESPQYAVMLNGKWGSGKTHYINEYKKKLDANKKKYLYISLYGVTSYDEIETKFLEQLYPKLYNKKTLLAGKIAKGLLKTTLKIDLDDDGKDDVSFSSQVPNLSAEDLLNTKDYILIFDDVERCSLQINDLLGYINYFVEHQDYRVILLANDEKFKSKKYKDIKEKLIGKTFEVVSNTELAYESFMKTIENQILIDFKNEIIEIYKQSKYHNLRVLRQVIFDFDRFAKVLQLETFKSDLVKDLVQIFFIFAIESRLGKLKLLELEKSKRAYESFIWKEDKEIDKEENKYYQLANKYNTIGQIDFILDFDLWNQILIKSVYDVKSIKSELLKSRFYLDENSPTWKKLWYFRNGTDNEFQINLTMIETELKNKQVNNIWEIRHIFSLLMHFSKNGLYSTREEEILEYFKQYIQNICDEGTIEKYGVENFENEIVYESYDGLEYYDESNEFSKQFLVYLSKSIKKYEERLVIEDAKELSSLLKKDSSKFKKLLVRGKYSYTPILNYIDTQVLLQNLLEVDYFAILDFGHSLNGRYKSMYNDELLIEKDFLVILIQELESGQEVIKGMIQGYNLNILIEHSLKKALRDIEQYEIRSNQCKK